MSLGVVVLDELILPITAVRLRAGRIEFECVVDGPQPERVLRGWRIHDPDGGIVVTAPDALVPIPHLSEDDSAVVTAPLECRDEKIATTNQGGFR